MEKKLNYKGEYAQRFSFCGGKSKESEAGTDFNIFALSGMGASPGCCFCWKLWGQRGFCQCFTSLWMAVWNCSKKCDSWLSRQVLQVKLSVYFNISGLLQCVSHGQKERGKLLLRPEHSHRIVLKVPSSCEPHANIHCPLPSQIIPAGNSCWASSDPCVHLAVDLYWYQTPWVCSSSMIT